MEMPLKRISLMIREDQYEKLTKDGINLSGLVRDLIDDHFSQHSITLTVSEETHRLYSQIVSQTGSGDVDLEPYLRTALHNLLKVKIQEMQKLEKVVFGKTTAKS